MTASALRVFGRIKFRARRRRFDTDLFEVLEKLGPIAIDAEKH